MFHIVFSADENYIKYTAVLIASIVKNTESQRDFKDFCNTKVINEIFSYFGDYDLSVLPTPTNTEEGYVFHILSNFVSEETQDKLKSLEKALSKDYPCKIIVHLMQESEFEVFPVSGAAHSNYLPYYRLKLGAFLEESIEKCLYLDSDMLCLFDIRELFAIDLKGKVVAVVGDCGTKRRKIKYVESQVKHTHYFDENYFNSGFLLLNTKEYQQQEIWQKCENLAFLCTYITAADQDLLNATIPQNMILRLPLAYNFQTINFCYAICKDEQKNRLNYTREEFTKSFKNPKILHYGEKPWKYLESYLDSEGKNISAIWWEYARITPVFGEELLKCRESIKDYTIQARLGWEVLEALKSPLGFFAIHSLLKDYENKNLEEIDGIPNELFGLCLILGEMIFFARNRKRGALNVILKAYKVKNAFLKYSKLSRAK